MSKYTLHFKYQAVLRYLHIRSQQRTADHCGISRTHLRRWIRAYQGEKSLPPSRYGRNIGTPPQTSVHSQKAQRKMADRRDRTQRKGRQTVPLADLGLIQPGNRRLRHEPQS